MDQRLNHTIFLDENGYGEVVLRETKVRVGRQVTVEALVEGQEENIHRVEQSLSLRVDRIRVSLVFSE